MERRDFLLAGVAAGLGGVAAKTLERISLIQSVEPVVAPLTNTGAVPVWRTQLVNPGPGAFIMHDVQLVVRGLRMDSVGIGLPWMYYFNPESPLMHGDVLSLEVIRQHRRA